MIFCLVCLYFVVLVSFDNVFVSICIERFEVFEGIVGGFIKGMGVRGVDINVNFGKKEDIFINILFWKEIWDLKKKLIFLEKLLIYFNFWIKELVERVLDFEFFLKFNSKNKIVCCKCLKKNLKISFIVNDVLK